jgi:ornithine carbamoyltransferase
MSHFISLKYLSSKKILELVELAEQIKKNPFEFDQALKGKYVGLLFEKPSLRTKTAFYIGALQLGGQAIYYTPQEVDLGKREQVCDASRTISSYLDIVVLRTFSHDTILEFAKFSAIPVINGLSDLLHPSQILADILTIRELKGDIKSHKVAYIGDGNNVCSSLIYCFSILGGNLSLAIPKEYFPPADILEEIKSYSNISGAKINITSSAEEASSGADVLYTDVWTSMGSESDRDKRKKAFKNFQINDTILGLANKGAIVMHCLPAHRGEEITDSVIEGESSVVFLQAGNRLHAAKAILTYVLEN